MLALGVTFARTVNESVMDRASNYSKSQQDDKNEKIFDKKYREYTIQYGFQKFDVK